MHDKTLLIFPTSRAIREYISILSGTNTFLSPSLSIGNFFQRAVYVPNKKLISKVLKTIYLQKVIQKIDIKSLGINSDFSSFLKQSEYIFRFFNELASEFKTIDDLEDADTYAHFSDHLEILQAVQIAYHKVLIDNGYYDQSLLPIQYKINEDYLMQFDKIEIIQEGIFSGFEQKVIDDISSFIDINIKYKENTANKNYDVQIVPISQRILQVGFVKQKIYEMIIKDKIDPNKIVVVLPDESFHETLALFDEEKYFNFAMGNKINQSKIKQIVQIINKILIDYEPKDDEKIKLYDSDNELFNELIKPSWDKIITKELFINIFDRLILCEINEEIIEKLNELKISLSILFFTTILNLKLKEIFKILQNKINEITLDDTHGGKITVLGLLETRAVGYDGVVVVDFNDDKIPKRSIKDKFLSTSVKEFANLPTSKRREDLQKYYYKNLFDRAKKIAICYVNDGISTKSRFISEIFPNEKDDNKIYDISHILFDTNKIKRFEKDIIKNINLSKQSWSATSLKTYLQCKRKYYFNYIEKIKEHSISLKPAGYELGDIIHKVLEKLCIENNLSTINLNNELTKYQNKNPYLTMQLEIWKRKLEKFVEIEKQRQEKDYKIFEVEKSFSFEYNGIRLKGTIDRIDKLNDGSYEILDYKTSSSLKVDTTKTYEKSCDFQLEFYVLSQRDKIINNVAYYDLNTATIKNEIMLEEKIKLLDLHLKALETTQVDFKLCEDKTQCLYCHYKIMCGRE